MVIASGAMAAGGVGFNGTPGTHAPPRTLNGFKMTKFGADARPLDRSVSFVKGPTGKVLFSEPVLHLQIGHSYPDDWATWSNGYTGSVYFTGPSNNSVTLTLPAGTKAFYFYVEPDQFGAYDVLATADGASSGLVVVSDDYPNAGGARYFGFYAENSHATVKKVKVSVYGQTGDGQGFAIGEFGIN